MYYLFLNEMKILLY